MWQKSESQIYSCNYLFSGLLQHLILATYDSFEIINIFFSYFFKSDNSFLHFPPSTLVYILGNFLSCGTKLHDFYSVKCIFWSNLLPFQQLATLRSCNILIFKFLWHLIPTTFCLKSPKFFLWLSQFLPLK